jgi:ATP-dependent Clp protease, protease subunit
VASPAPVLPEQLYAMYCGGIEQANSQKVVSSLAAAMANKVRHIHVLFQSAGGYIADGVFLYNLFRTMPIEITLYNGGQISSAGVIAYLGAAHRITGANATFMIHRSTNSPQVATASKLAHTAKSLVLDDDRCEGIIRSHVSLPPELWTEMQYHDVYLTGNEALQYGMATGVADFAPPSGSQVYNLLG